MEHLTAIDAAFLQLETAETPMHLASVHMLKLPPGYQGNFPDEFRRHIQSRLHLAPMLTRKLVSMPLDLANPVWVHDDDVDIGYHVRSLSLASPGTHAQLMAMVGRLHSTIMDRTRPLWEISLIEGVQDADYAMYLKLHHAGLDGLAGQRLVQALYDVTPVPRTVDPPMGRVRERSTSTGALFVASLANAATQAARVFQSLPDTIKMVVGMVQGMRTATGEQNPKPERRRFSIGPPRVHFNTTVTNQRLFAGCSTSIDEMKVITQARGCTLNDVVMAVSAGALRRYLLRHNDLPEEPLSAFMPVSVRQAGDVDMSNRVTAARCDLHTDIADPIERLTAICGSTADIKSNLENTRKGMPTDFPSIGVPWLLPLVIALVGKLHLADRLPPIANVVVSNVPLSPKPLYVAGAQLTSYWPVLILMHGMGLGIATHSYAGSMEWGVVGCRQSLPDVADLADDVLASFAELLEAVKAQAAPQPATSEPAPKRRARKTAARPAASDATVAAPQEATVDAAAGGGAARKGAVRKRVARASGTRAGTANGRAADGVEGAANGDVAVAAGQPAEASVPRRRGARAKAAARTRASVKPGRTRAAAPAGVA